MSGQQLIQALEKLVKLHSSLHAVTLTKTEVIKKGDIESLQQVMKEEQAHIMSIQKLEEARATLSKRIAPHYLNPTLSDCIKKLPSEEAQKASEIAQRLKEIIIDLKETNTLNQQLLRQSMQFVNVSLNLLKPTKKSINYGKPANGDGVRTDHIGKQESSLLNFKA